MATSVNEWNFTETHVEPDIIGKAGEKNQNYISSESFVLCAAPPVISANAAVPLATSIFPIGVLESAAIAQNKQIQQLFEIGSRRPYFIPGRTRIQVGLSRVIFNGNSLMAKVYDGVEGLATDEAGFNDSPNDAPGYPSKLDDENFYFNLASSFFNKPFGLIMIMKDTDKDDAAMIYLENCMIQSHNMNIGANQTIIMENVNIICDGIQPVKVDLGSSPA